MNSRERLLMALDRHEPDRVPLDLCSTQVTGIHVAAYRRLRQELGLPQVESQLCDSIQQLALPDDDLLGRLGVDARGLFPLNSHNWQVHEKDGGDHWVYHDELPDFLEIGVQILNPVHISAAGMDPVGLKRDFGHALVFWGGGVDTQRVLPRGTPQQVRDEVRRSIDALAPGGGFVFNPVHNIQADVPAENVIAMCEALQEYGAY